MLGFQALATTSAGFSFSRGLPDSPDALPVDAVLDHISEIVAASDLPVNADFQAGYAPDPEGVAVNVQRCLDTGVAGLSIEDTTTDHAKPLFELSEAVERIAAARTAIDSSGEEVLLTARAECFLVGHPDPLRESIHRLQAYSEAGADVLSRQAFAGARIYAPSSTRSSPSPSTFLSAPTPDYASKTWPNSVFAVSAWAPPLGGPPGELSCTPPKPSPRTAASPDSTAPLLSRS